MSADDLEKDRAEFQMYSEYYDILYGDKDYFKESEYIRSLLKRSGLASGEILEFGSGTGKHGRILAEHGFIVTGVEQSAAMVALAQPSQRFRCIVGDAGTVKLEKRFDAVLALFHVVSYQTKNEEVIRLFKNATEHLKPGGIFAFDVWYSPAVGKHTPEVRIKRASSGDLEVTRLAEPVIKPNQNQVDVHYTILAQKKAGNKVKSFKEVHRMRHFSLPEIELIASLTGFDLVISEQFLTSSEPSADTWGVCFVLKKS